MNASAGEALLRRDVDLARRLVAGDESVLREILAECGGQVWRQLKRAFDGVLSAADLEDVISVALYRLWQSRTSYDAARGTLAGWFYSIARHAALDILRHGWHKARQLEVPAAWELAVQEPSEPQCEEPFAAGDSETQHMLSELRVALAQLPTVQRRILEADAHVWPQVAESKLLAEELGIAARSVPVYRKRALDSLRAVLRGNAARTQGA